MRTDGIITLGSDGTGSHYAPARGLVEVVEKDTSTARRALLTACVDQARELGRPVIIEAREGEATYLVAVDPSGRITEAGDPGDDADESPLQPRATTSRSHRVRIPRLRNGDRPAWAIPALIVTTVTLAMAGLWLASVIFGGTSNIRMETERGGRFEAPVPVGWSADARWRTSPLAADMGRARVIGGDVVAFASRESRQVYLVDAASGDVRWSQDLPSGAIVDGLQATTIEGQVVVAAHVGNRLAWWALETGAPGGVDLPAGAKVVWAGAQPAVVLSPTSAATVSGGQLATVAVPRGARVYAALGDGTISAASSEGWWQLAAGQPATEVTPWAWRTTLPIRPDVIGYAGGRYVLHLAPQAAGQPNRVLVYRDRPIREGGPVWSFDSPITPSGQRGDEGRAVETWSPSSSLTWGILGRTLVDFSAEKATDLGPWRTTHVLSDRAYGTVGDQTAVAGPAIPATVVDAAAGVPDDLTTAGALIRTHSEDGIDREYLLPEVQP